MRALALSPQATGTHTLLAEAAAARGMETVVLTPGTDLTALRGRCHYYGGPHFAAKVSGDLDLALIEPPDDLLTKLPYESVRREVRAMDLAEARGLRVPSFVKPPSDKSFAACVYADGSRLPAELPGDLPVLVSEVATFTAEYRLFVLDGEVHAGSRYARFGRLDPAPLGEHAAAIRTFVSKVVAWLPSAVVLDVGLLTTPDRDDERWAVVEANMAWFSNIYAADPARALDVVLASSGPRGFVR